MLEGKVSRDFFKARKYFYEESLLAHKLLDKITSTLIIYLSECPHHGCNILQLNDLWMGHLNSDLFGKFYFPYLKRIALEVDGPLFIFRVEAHTLMIRSRDWDLRE